MQNNLLSAILQSFREMTKIKHIKSLPKSINEKHVIYEIENQDFEQFLQLYMGCHALESNGKGATKA